MHKKFLLVVITMSGIKLTMEEVTRKEGSLKKGISKKNGKKQQNRTPGSDVLIVLTFFFFLRGGLIFFSVLCNHNNNAGNFLMDRTMASRLKHSIHMFQNMTAKVPQFLKTMFITAATMLVAQIKNYTWLHFRNQTR
jgi:hypothetical protein